MFFDEKDWFMREIKKLTYFIAKMIFKSNTVEYQQNSVMTNEDSNELYKTINLLFAQGKYNEAENELFQNLSRENNAILWVAIDFYTKLSECTSQQLETANFSEAEIQEGLRDVLKYYEISVPV